MVWWSDPGKEVLNIIFNRVLAPYVDNLDMNQVNYGIGQGRITLGKLHLKRGALDKFRLPVDVIEGHLGKFTLSLHWLNLGNQPVEIVIEDVFLLVTPSSESAYDEEESERRAQAAKAERLENSELLHMQNNSSDLSNDSAQSQGLISSLIAKIVNNLQVTVRNVHIRYEDKLSVPGHPFAAGITLAGFTAVSVNEHWQPAFIDSAAGAIHKLANLESLAIYFDTDADSMAGLAYADAVNAFKDLISRQGYVPKHQFILKPVTGEGRIIMNHMLDKETPKFDVQLLFDEIGVLLDDNQYRDAISLIDMYHFYIRQHQYQKYRPSPQELARNKPRALWRFAGRAIQDQVHERKRKWTWSYFAERRDDRYTYVDLYKKKLIGPLLGADLATFEALEKKLSYEDIRFYRSIARSQFKKDVASRKKIEDEKNKQQRQSQSSSWGSWLWGSADSSQSSTSESAFSGEMTDEQRRELYEVLDYDEKSALAESFETARDALKLRIAAQLNRGSFALKTDPNGNNTEIVAVVFDVFQATFLQRPDNFEVSMSLGGFAVHDGTTQNTLYPEIVHVQESRNAGDKVTVQSIGNHGPISDVVDPFFFLKFENNPLDERADSALTVRMRYMEIVYHRGYIEAIYKFFKPPSSQLESVEALLDAASETLDGLRAQTRAGLEYALQTHRTIDVQMDLNAPIIIVPEDITTKKCTHLVIDAGHISIESQLANKKAVQEIQAKRKQQYTEEDYNRLEEMMYDKLLVKLQAAQFLIGNDLDSCLHALTASDGDNLHLLERVNLDLEVQNSMVPTAYNLARFKISAHLPALEVNLSDSKYKSLMKLVDVAIPNFNDDNMTEAQPVRIVARRGSGTFKLPTGIFATVEEYNVDEDEEDKAQQSVGKADEPRYFDSDDGSAGNLALHQHTVELNFHVDILRASLYKSGPHGEKAVGDVCLERFGLAFSMAQYVMKVDVKLSSLSMNVIQPGHDPIEFISSAEAKKEQDLLTVGYTRVQQTSPEFVSVYDGVDQNVDIKVATLVFRAAPEPLLSLYEFIMTTFVPQNDSPVIQPPSEPSQDALQETVQSDQPAAGCIRVLLQLASVQVVLVNDEVNLATLSLSTADGSILLQAEKMLIKARLGSLAVNDDSELQTAIPEFKQILSIEGNNFVDFQYRTFGPEDKESRLGIRSLVKLNAGSLKVHYLEEPLHNMYSFVSKLTQLKGLYDAATEAAVQSASEINRMQFDVTIKSPILVFPSNAQQSSDVLSMRLGEFSSKNTFEGSSNNIKASLRGIRLASHPHGEEESSMLKIVDDIDATADISQTSGIDRSIELKRPDTQISVRISDVKLNLTQFQYQLLFALSQSIPKVFTNPEDISESNSSPTLEHNQTEPSESSQPLVDLQPEIRANTLLEDGTKSWTSVDLFITINAVKLHLYDGEATAASNLKEHGIARFALNNSSLRAKVQSDGAIEAQVVLKSFTMSNTRPGNSKFREIIPAAQHDRNQVMLLFTMSGGVEKSSFVVATVESPQVIFAIEPVIALLGFFSSISSQTAPQEPVDVDESEAPVDTVAANPSRPFAFRFDLHDASISILENDSDPETQAVQLTVKQVLLSQQGILALSVDHLGMSLTKMGKSAESVRFMDDVDMTFSLDDRSNDTQQSSSIEVSIKPIVFRASYRDIMLITTIVNKAIQLYGNISHTPDDDHVPRPAQSIAQASRPPARSSASRGSNLPQSRPPPVGHARVLVTKEQFKGSIDGFRLILIGDLHEQPMLHLRVKPFTLGAKDWSGELQASTTLAVHITYWNLTNSHWEPLIDPWVFTTSVAKEGTSGAMALTISSKERLNVNITTTLVELVLATVKIIGEEGDRVLKSARGSYAPYRIRNRTGATLSVWNDAEGDNVAKEIAPGKTVEWRFDDWKTMREHVSSSGHHNIGVRILNKPWEQLRSIPVEREGEYLFSLRPRTDKYAHRLLCEIKVQDNAKVVTLRSAYKIENLTLYPLELTLVDETGQPVHSVEKIAPGQDYALPIESVSQHRIKIQPDQGFGYKWSSAIRWEDLVAKRSFTIRCPHSEEGETAFRFQAWVDTDITDMQARKFPKISLKLRAPIELENLLPYDLEYRIYDKDTDQNWRSYLRRGGVMPVHSVEHGHLILLNIQAVDTAFKPSEFAIINTDGNSDFDTESRMTLRDAMERSLDLRLNYIRYPDSGGSFKVQIYSPYLVINKTGLPFAVRPSRSNLIGPPQEVAGDTRPEILSKPTPFMLSHPSEQGKDFIFKVGDSTWSQPVSLEAPSADTRLVIPSASHRQEEIHVGLSWTEGSGKYKLTKVITLTPRFIIKNNFTEAISFREHGFAPRGRSTLNQGERCPLHFIRVGEGKLLTVAITGLNAQWSAPINIEDIGTVHFRLQSLGEPSTVHLLRADVKLDGSTIFVYLSQATEGWPFTIENDSDYSFTIWQTDERFLNGEPLPKSHPKYTASSKSSVGYAWDYPAARGKKIILAINDARRAIDIMEIGDLMPFRFSVRQGVRAVSLDVRADGSKQVLRITNYNPEVSLYRPRQRSSSVSLIRQDTISGSQEAFEAVQEDIPPSFTVTVDFEGLGVSLVNRKSVEVVYMSLNKLIFEYTDSPVSQSANINCGSIQIDNQLHDALFPVVLQPTPIAQDASGVAALSTIQGSIIWLKDQEHGVFFVKYCSILLQALSIEADEDFLYAIFDLTKLQGAPWNREQEDILIQYPDDIPEPQDSSSGQNLYFEVLELQPIRLAISFMRTERVNEEDQLSIHNPFAVVLNAVTMTVGNINDAPLEMNALAIKDMRLTLPELEDRIMHHYRQEVLRQLYRILGSADFIGNPVGLFTNVSSGVADIFYEPYNGVVMHGNRELGIGIAKGAASFVKKTVFGFSDSFTKFTSSVGKGLSATTFDAEYQLRRRMNQRRNKPRHAIYGVTAGAEALANSIVSGVEGVVMKPIEGAESEGAKGFFKGVGKGLIGAVTKPMVGVFDLASNLSEGIRNTTTVFDNPARDRVRLPRLTPADGVLVPYSDREALGQYWLRDLERGAYRRELYVAHINLPGGDNVILLTNSRVLSFWSNNLRLEWDLPFSHVQGVTIEDTGIKFAHKGGREQDKFIFIPDKSSQTWFFAQVASVVKAYNAKRRMDS